MTAFGLSICLIVKARKGLKSLPTMLEESNETIFQMKDAMYFSFKELQLNMNYIFCIAIRSNITLHALADFLEGCAPPQLHSSTPPTCFAPPQHLLAPPNIFAPYPRNYSIRGQAAYVPPNYSFLQLQATPVLTFLMLSGTF